ncbi:MAG: hypothetical protein P8X65_15235 [Syntrophobacterales bacterium]
MVKNVFFNPGACAALVALGWFSFFGGLLLNSEYYLTKIFLLAIARVLP